MQLVAPLVAVMMLDEACLRFYLLFSTNLLHIMESWGIGRTGYEAYRYGFCSRTLVTQFSWVWLSLAILTIFFVPAWQLITRHSWYTNLERKFRAKLCNDDPCCYVRSLKNRENDLSDVITLYTLLLTVVCFGPVCPLLYIMGPPAVCSNLLAIRWAQSHLQEDSTQQRVTHALLAHVHPTKTYVAFAVFGQWIITSFVFFDFQFDEGPVVFYIVYWVLQLLTVGYWWKYSKLTWVDWVMSSKLQVDVSIEQKVHDYWLITQATRAKAMCQLPARTPDTLTPPQDPIKCPAKRDKSNPSGLEVSPTALYSERDETFEGFHHEMFVASELQNVMEHFAAPSARSSSTMSACTVDMVRRPDDAPIMHSNRHHLQGAKHAHLVSECEPELDMNLELKNSLVEEQLQTHLCWQNKVHVHHCDPIETVTFANPQDVCSDIGKSTCVFVDFKCQRDASMPNQTDPIPQTADQSINPCISGQSDQQEATAAEQASVEIETIKSLFRGRANKRKAARKAR